MSDVIEVLAAVLHKNAVPHGSDWAQLAEVHQDLYRKLARVSYQFAADNVTDEMVEAYQNELSRQIGTTYMRTPEGAEEVRHSIAAALRAVTDKGEGK